MGKEVKEVEDLGNDLLDNFGWDAANDNDISFETPPAVTKAAKVLKEVEETDVTIKPVKKVTAKDKDDEDDDEDQSAEYVPFSDEIPVEGKTKDEDDEEEDKDDKTKVVKSDDSPSTEEDDKKFYTTLASELKEKGIFSSVDLKEDQEIDEEEFFELQEQEVELRFEETLKGFFEEINNDEGAVALMKYVKNGGKSSDFFQTFSSAPSAVISEDIDLTKEANQKKVARVYLQTVEKLEDSDIDDRIEYLEEKAKLEETSEKWHTKLMAIDKKQKDDLLKSQADAREAAKKNAEELRTKLQKELDDNETIGSFKFNDKEKKNLVSAITKPTVKVGENRYITSLQSKMTAVMKDPKKLLILAKLIESDFDTTDLVTEIETKVTGKVKDKLTESRKVKNLKSSGSGNKQHSLADFFTG